MPALLGNAPSLVVLTQFLIEHIEGHSFFLEESVWALVEAEVLAGEPKACRLGQALPTIQVPATVQAIQAVRIDRLPPDNQRFPRTTAVIGHEVPMLVLQTIVELPEADLLSEAYLRAGRMDETIEVARHDVHLARDYQELGNEAYAIRLLGEVVAHHDPPELESAPVYYRQSLALAEELGNAPAPGALCHHGLRTLLTKVDQRA